MHRSFLLAAVSCLISAPALAATERFHATLDGQHEVPPVQTNGRGSFDATLDPATRKLDYTLTFSDLSGPPMMAHLHGPAKPGQNANVQVPLPSELRSPVKGSATLSEQQVKMLEDGNMYTNIHTQEHKAGEIRGQVERAK